MAQMYTIHVHAIPLSDGDGKGANTVSKATFQEAVARLDLFRYFTVSDPIYSRARGRSVDSYWRGGETARQEDRARHHSEGFIFRVLLTALTIWLFAAPSAWAKEVQSTEPTLEAIEKAFESAVGQLTGGDSKGAVLALEDLRARHGKRLDARLRHGISSVLMFAHLTLPDEAAAARVGATLFRELPEAFVSFKELSNGITDPVASSIYVLTILTAKGESLIYLHNASKEAIEIRQANKFAVKYGYKTTSTSVGSIETDGSPGLPMGGEWLTLPGGGGALVQARSGGGLLAMLLPDTVTIIAAAATPAKQPTWVHLSKGGYEQTLSELKITADQLKSGGKTVNNAVLLNVKQ